MSKRSDAMRERFCQEYIIDANGTQAAIRAGYSEKTACQTASRLLSDVNVLTRVRELFAEKCERLALTADRVLISLWEVYERCMQQKPVMVWDKEQKEYVATGEYVFDSKGALGALELIGKHLAMFSDKLKVTGSVDTTAGKLDDLLRQLEE